MLGEHRVTTSVCWGQASGWQVSRQSVGLAIWHSEEPVKVTKLWNWICSGLVLYRLMGRFSSEYSTRISQVFAIIQLSCVIMITSIENKFQVWKQKMKWFKSSLFTTNWQLTIHAHTWGKGKRRKLPVHHSYLSLPHCLYVLHVGGTISFFKSNVALKLDFPSANDWCVRVKRAERKSAFMVKQHVEQLGASLDRF